MDIRKRHSQLINRARQEAGVEDLMKVYERFQKAFDVTEEYLQLVAPKTHQANSNGSLVT